jgi:Arc/MetJ-type ribon-helix-helix transcriptional regulator
MDVRLNQAVSSLKSSLEISHAQKEKKSEGLDFEAILLDQTGNGLKEAQAVLQSSASKIFEEMAEVWFAYEDLLSASDSYDDEYNNYSNFGGLGSFGSASNEELERIEELVKAGGYYSVDSVVNRLFSAVSDVMGGKINPQLADSLASALKLVEKDSGELPEALYDALEAASYKIRKA